MNRRILILIGLFFLSAAAHGSIRGATASKLSIVSLSASILAPEVEEKVAPSVFSAIKASAVEKLTRLGINAEAAKLYAKWIVGAPTLVIAILVAMLLRPRKKIRRSTDGSRSEPYRIKSAVVKKFSKELQAPEPKTDKEWVLRFFSQLFKLQLGAPPDAPTELVLIERRSTCPNETYEMRVKLADDWASRRMSLGLLGQGGGSRSKCFYVIYDSHMVLKLPSDPIPRFSAYYRRIAAEAHIVERLAPRECIVPRVAVILNAVHTLPGGNRMSDEEQEQQYVRLLKTDPDIQEYLKIGKSFAFFMDLAKHFFLSTTLEEIHQGDQRIVNEAMKQHELLWDQHGFVCRYGDDAGLVCHNLQEAYYRCESRLRHLVEEAHAREAVSTFQFKQWFLTHLAGEKIDPGAYQLDDELIERVNRLLTRVIKENHVQVAQYRRSVQGYIREIRFSQHLSQLENLSSNTLDLLAWLGDKKMAMRDLKPENLFVAGNPRSYPIFLNDADNFSIGLIDVETAVLLDDEVEEDIPQPQLAGTPLYATPSHLLSNVVLGEIYPDIEQILLLQDWYATIGIIYKTITGSNLFSATARVFPEIVKRVKRIDPTGPDLGRDVIRISSLFWRSAIAEFQESLARQAQTFSRVEVRVPQSLLPPIVKALHRDCDRIGTALANTVSRQGIFSGREKCQFLMDAPVEKIGRMKKKLLEEKRSGGWRPEQRVQALEVLDRIEQLKTRLQRKLEAAAALKTTGEGISADQLLEAMFECVFSAMYLPHWPDLTPAKWSGVATLNEDIETYQATM
jgi:serine/threonine protein kinase